MHLLYVFIGCFAFGVFYAIASLILGGHGHGGDHGIDHGGGADFGHGAGIGHDIGISHGIGAGHGVGLDHGIGGSHGGGLGHDVGIGHGIGADHGIAPGHDAGMSHGAWHGHVLDAGHDTAADGSAAAGHGADVRHGSDSADVPSPFNPLVIASAITTFGAIGIISMKGFGLGGMASTIVALCFAGAIGAAIFFGIVKFMYGSQSNTVFSLEDLAGLEGEIITPVPEKGLGEIVCMINGMRHTMPARSIDGKAIARGAAAIIREISGNVACVQQKLTIDDIDICRPDLGELDNSGEMGRNAGKNRTEE